MPNRYPGTCARCRRTVSEGEGFAQRTATGRWEVRCATTTCLAAEAIAAVVAAPAPVGRRLTADGRVLTPYESANLPLLRSFPGARWDAARKCWTVSLAPGDRARVLEIADKLRLDVDAFLRADVVAVDPRALAARERASDPRLYPFQRTGVEFLALRDRALLADDMGLGKTVQALLALPADAGVMVVCPASVKHNWRVETARWRPDLRTSILEGRGSFRWPEAGEVVICNPDILPGTVGKDADGKPEVTGIPAKPTHEVVLIADEAHAYKSAKASRSQKMRALVAMVSRAWALTGTPLLGRPLDLWGMIQSFDLGYDVFGGWKGFLRLFGGSPGRWGGWDFAGPSTPEAAERLRRVSLRRTKREVLPDLPGKTHTVLTVNGLSRSLVRDLDALWTEYEEALADGCLPAFEEMSAARAKNTGSSLGDPGDRSWASGPDRARARRHAGRVRRGTEPGRPGPPLPAGH